MNKRGERPMVKATGIAHAGTDEFNKNVQQRRAKNKVAKKSRRDNRKN